MHLCADFGSYFTVTMPASRQRLTFAQQLQVIDFYHEFKSDLPVVQMVTCLRDLGFSTTCAATIRRYVQKEASIRHHVATHPHSSSARARSDVALPEVEDRLWQWIQGAQNRHLRLTGLIIKMKARQLAAEMQVPAEDIIGFSDGWLARFKRRYGIKNYVFHGEASSAPTATIIDEQSKLHALLVYFPPYNRFNVDETGLNFKMSPNSGLASHPLPGLKLDKSRLTYVLCTSEAGEKLRPFVIGHAKRPRCFTHGDPAAYGFYYANNKKAWMRSDLWQK